MGDISAEPSMEEILSSIKRIIAEEGEPAPARSRRSPARPSAPPARSDDVGDDDDVDDPSDVLELSDAIPVASSPPPSPPPAPAGAPAPSGSGDRREQDTAPLVSRETLAATRGALDSLSRLVTRPEPGSDGTLEGLVREMLRPMMSEWLDANLPAIVERIVAREVAKITGAR